MSHDTRPEEVAAALANGLRIDRIPIMEWTARIRAYGDERAREARAEHKWFCRCGLHFPTWEAVCKHQSEQGCDAALTHESALAIQDQFIALEGRVQRDALDGQAALDEANNHCAAADALLREWVDIDSTGKAIPEWQEGSWTERVRKHLEGKSQKLAERDATSA